MKKLILAFFIIILIVSCTKDEVDLEKEKILSNLTIYFSPFKYGQQSLEKILWRNEDYNSSGQLVNLTYRSSYDFDSETNWLQSETYTYKNGVKVEMFEDNLISQYRHVYHYLDGKLNLEEIFDEEGLLEKNVYSYKNGSNLPYLLQHWWYYFDSDPIEYYYTYDSKGNSIKDSIWYSSSQPYGIILRKFDYNNNLTEETYYSSDTKKTTYQKICAYKYLSSSNKISQYVFNTYYTFIFQKHIYNFWKDDSIDTIDVYESESGINGNYEQIGILIYEYTYK